MGKLFSVLESFCGGQSHPSRLLHHQLLSSNYATMAGCKKKVREVEFYDSSTNFFSARLLQTHQHDNDLLLNASTLIEHISTNSSLHEYKEERI
jgi:hypothetical protein